MHWLHGKELWLILALLHDIVMNFEIFIVKDMIIFVPISVRKGDNTSYPISENMSHAKHDSTMNNHHSDTVKIPTKGLRRGDINDDFFIDVSNQLGMKLKTWRSIHLDDATSIIAQNTVKCLSDTKVDKLTGLYAFELIGISANTSHSNKPDEVSDVVVLKAKALDTEILDSMLKMVALGDLEETKVMGKIAYSMHPKLCHEREVVIAAAALNGAAFQSISPAVYCVHRDDENEVLYFIMEFFGAKNFTHIDAIEGATGLECWDEVSIRRVLSDIAAFHASFLDRTDQLSDDVTSVMRKGTDVMRVSQCHSELAIELNNRRFPDVWSEEMRNMGDSILESFQEIMAAFDEYPQTIVHNDLNPRNLCLRKEPGPQQRHLCAYDWEMACIHVPQRDLAEFLAFSQRETISYETWIGHLEFYRSELHACLKAIPSVSGSRLLEDLHDKERFYKIFDYAMMDLLVGRLQLYFSVVPGIGVMLPFLPRVVAVTYRYLTFVRENHSFLT